MGDYGQYIVSEAKDMINLKVGQPAPSLLPLDDIRECANLKFAETDPMFLQYGHIYGYPKFRKSLAAFLSKGYGSSVDPERLLVTNGVTGGLSLICSLFCQSGDLVFMEEPTYFLALSIMKDFHLNIRQIPMEQDGIDIAHLEGLLARGIIPKMMYTIPTCHNPTGRTLSETKRAQLVQLSIKYNFLIVADEVYQLLSFPHITPPPPMFTFDRNNTVLCLGSFSKILAPALRLGWIQASPSLLSKIASCGQLDSSGGMNPVISGIVHCAIDSGRQLNILERSRQTLWNRADALLRQLQLQLPKSVVVESPNGGYFILVRLPQGCDSTTLLQIAQEKYKVMFLPGASFSGNMREYLRLSFSWYNETDLKEGATRLAEAIKKYQSMNEITKQLSSKKKIVVAIHGHRGRLGSLIVQEITKDERFLYAGPVLLGESTVLDSVDVVVDVTLPEGTRDLVQYLSKVNSSPALVVGTTGELPLDELRNYSQSATVFVRSNFSVGVPLLCELARRAAFQVPQSGWNVSVSEIHHTKKLDAPSGTAKTIVRSIASTGAKCTEKDGRSHIPCTSMRLGDEIGQHIAFFAGPGERIEIKHQATDRRVFAIGALRACSEAYHSSPGFYQL